MQHVISLILLSLERTSCGDRDTYYSSKGMCGIVFVVGSGQKSWGFDHPLFAVAIKMAENPKGEFVSS
jgi:hypothetical protein